MGITIHYKSKGKKISAKKVDECLNLIESIAKTKKWKILNKINEQFNNIQFSRDWNKTVETAKNIKQMGINILPHPDCESVLICFYTTNNKDYSFGTFFKYRDDIKENYTFHDWQFTKTQYAGIDTHVEVVKLLKVVETFIPLDVSDEGGYWETNDIVKLGKNFGENLDMILSLTKTLTKAFDVKNVISSHEETKGWHNDYLDYKIKNKKKS